MGFRPIAESETAGVLGTVPETKTLTLIEQVHHILCEADNKELGWHELTDDDRKLISQAVELGLIT